MALSLSSLPDIKVIKALVIIFITFLFYKTKGKHILYIVFFFLLSYTFVRVTAHKQCTTLVSGSVFVCFARVLCYRWRDRRPQSAPSRAGRLRTAMGGGKSVHASRRVPRAHWVSKTSTAQQKTSGFSTVRHRGSKILHMLRAKQRSFGTSKARTPVLTRAWAETGTARGGTRTRPWARGASRWFHGPPL